LAVLVSLALPFARIGGVVAVILTGAILSRVALRLCPLLRYRRPAEGRDTSE
jgi:hypothetical protein